METGTYTGEMVHAMSGHVDRIISIEVAPALHAQGRQAFRRPAAHSTAARRQRRAAAERARIARRDPRSSGWTVTTWVEKADEARDDTPIMAELTALVAHPVRGHVVLIDDARLFDGTGGYPRLDELTAWVKARRPGTQVSVDGDIIRCVFDAV